MATQKIALACLLKFGLNSASMIFASSLCYGLATVFLGPLRRYGSRTPAIKRFDSNEQYFKQRVAETSQYRQLFSPFVSFEGKTVLDLGCNRGYLLHSFLQNEKFKAIGADLVSYYLKDARRDYGDIIDFIETTPSAIPLPDNSVDVVYTIDTVEHLSQPREIFLEVYRILKPGGIFLVHFNPWLNPHGSHLDDVIPFPWPHVLFSMDTLLSVAAKLYDSPRYDAACYFLDEEGNKKPNPYLDREQWSTYLNHMTIRRFNELLNQTPFLLTHQEKIGFGGHTFKLSRTVRGL
ncbi:MAG TPA: class I SAM-dependent methyltransferase, partial [Pyrinomonadaceae bacterium]|nr:class I SAM-dependent methyltransferase [Pyrinomonadaceae bacterium]